MKLLLVEDNPMLVTELEKQLKLAGYVTDITDKALEADYLIKETQYDCADLRYRLARRQRPRTARKAGVIKGSALQSSC